MAATIEMARQYLGIDVDDDEMINANLSRALAAAHALMLGAVGDDIETLLPGDPRIDELQLALTADLYGNRSTSAKAGTAEARYIHSLEQQLRLDHSRLKREAEE